MSDYKLALRRKPYTLTKLHAGSDKNAQGGSSSDDFHVH